MARGLGKGINALFTNIEIDNEEHVQDIKLTELRPNPYQPRKTFTEETIKELTQSIKEHGILQPIIARKSIKGYEIVVGERRYRAAKLAGLEVAPVVVREITEQQMMELAVLENLQREDLTPIEEATAYQMLIDRLNLTQEQLAKRLGKSRPYIANHIRLLSLPTEVQSLITDGKISMGHGRTLLGLKDKTKLTPLVNRLLKENLNVRQLEQLVQKINENVPRETNRQNVERKKDVFIVEQESYLREKFGTNVLIKQQQSQDRGKIEIQFASKRDLERILSLLE